MAIVRFDPFDLKSFWRWPASLDDDVSALETSQLDVYETKDNVVVKAGIAGVKSDRVDITFEDGVLRIYGEEEKEDEDEEKKYYRKSSRSYSYKIAVPGNIDLSVDPEAKVEDGVVTVTFKKAEEAKPRKIKVKTK